MAFDPTWVRQVERWRRFLAEKQVTQPQPQPQAGMPQPPGYAYRPPAQAPVTIDPRRLPVWLGGGAFPGAQPQPQAAPAQPLDVGALPAMPPGGLEQTIEGFNLPGLGKALAPFVMPGWLREPEAPEYRIPQWLQGPVKFAGYLGEQAIGRIGAAFAEPEARRFMPPVQPGGAPVEIPPVQPEEYPELWDPLARLQALGPQPTDSPFLAALKMSPLVGPLVSEAAASVGGGMKMWEAMTQAFRGPRAVEMAAAPFWQLLQEPSLALRGTVGAAAISAYQPKRKYGLEMEDWIPLTERTWSLAFQQGREYGMFYGPTEEWEETGTGRGIIPEALADIAAGRATAEQIAMANEHLGAELVGLCLADPLNLIDAVDVGVRLARAQHLTRAQARVAAAVADNPKALKTLNALAEGLARTGADEAEMLRLATEAKGIKTPARLWNKVKEVFSYPFELVPEAKVIRDLGDTWIVLAGPMAIPKSGDEALDLLRMWVDEPEALRPFFGALVDSPAGRKAATILEHTMDQIENLPSLKAELFDPRMLMAEMDPVMHGALRQAHGWKELGRVEQFFHGYKALISEFYLTGIYSPGYMFRNFGSDFTGMAFDGLATFEKSANIDKFFDDLAAGFLPRRIETKGTGLREAFTGIPEGETKLPGVFGWLSKKGQEMVQHAEPFGVLPLGEEPRYRRAFYKAVKRFFDQNAPGMTPALPEAVARFFGPRADDLHQAVSRAVSMQAKRKILDDFLTGTSKGAMIDPARYIEPELLDSVSPEMMGRVRDRLGKLTGESTKEEVVEAFEELRGLVDDDELERMAELEILPEIQGSPDVREVEIADEMVDRLEEAIQKAKDDPRLADELTRELEEVKRRIPEVEEELTVSRQGAIDELLTEPQPDGLEILMVAYRDTADLQDETRRIMNRLLKETRTVAQSNPAAKSQAWGDYFRNARREWENLATARAARMTEAQAQLRRLRAGESLDEILGARAAIDEHVEMLRRASEVLPEPEKGWLPGRVTEDADRFDRFLAWQRARFDRARAKAWRAVYGAEGDNYGPILDLLNSAETDIERYGKATAGRVRLLREKAFADSAAAFRKHKDPKMAEWAKDAVWEKYYIQRNDAWSKFWKASEQRWKLAERDILIDNYHKGPRMAPPQPLEVAPEAVAAEIQPGDVELVKSAAPKADADWTPEERAAVERWTGAGRSVPEPVQEVLPTPRAAGIPPYSRDRFYQDLIDTFGATEKQAEDVLSVWDAVAERWSTWTGRPPQEFFTEYLAGFRRGEAPAGAALFQRVDDETLRTISDAVPADVGMKYERKESLFAMMPGMEDYWKESPFGAMYIQEGGRFPGGAPQRYSEILALESVVDVPGLDEWAIAHESLHAFWERNLPIDVRARWIEAVEDNPQLLARMQRVASHYADMGTEALADEAFVWIVLEGINRQPPIASSLIPAGQQAAIVKAAREAGLDPELLASATRPWSDLRADIGKVDVPWEMMYQTAEDWAPRWWYKAEQVITDRMPNNASVEQVKNILTKGGIKQDELQWNNVLDWLGTQEGTVSKDDVLTYLMENRVQVQEVVMGGTGPRAGMTQAEAADELEQMGYTIDLAPDDFTGEYVAESISHPQYGTMYADGDVPDEARPAFQVLMGLPGPGMPRFGQYTLPGGEQYRELLLTLPHRTRVPGADVPEQYQALQRQLDRLNDRIGRGDYTDLARAQEERAALERRIWGQRVGQYQAPHWEEENVLAHVRFNERTGPNGERVLFIEEIQSDWHQAGRERGYTQPALKQELLERQRAVIKKQPYYSNYLPDEAEPFRYWFGYEGQGPRRAMIVEMPYMKPGDWINVILRDYPMTAGGHGAEYFGSTFSSYDEIAELFGEDFADFARKHAHLQDEARHYDIPGDWSLRQQYEAAHAGAVPAAPFAKSWDELTLKRMYRWAAENDFDSIAWTTGAQQADRYNLARVADEVAYWPEDETLVALKDHREVFTTTASPEQLSDYIGKDAARRLMDPDAARIGSIRGEKLHVISGEDLRVGGQGMAGFYDRILPYSSNKLTKRWGVQVEDLQVATGHRIAAVKPLTAPGYDAVHGLRITPQMKRDLLTEGLPLFQQRKGAAQILDDGRALIHAFEGADITTVIHETGHIFRRVLKQYRQSDHALLEIWAGVSAGKWEVRHEEKFARAFERYFAEGVAPTPQLQGVFERFKEWILDIYKQITGSAIDVEINDTVRGVLDRFIAEEPPVRPGDWRGREIEAIRREQQIAPFRQAMQRAKSRHPLSLQDASQMFGMDLADPRLGDQLADIAQKHELLSTPEHLRAEAWKQAHHKLEETKYIEIGGYTRELKYERRLTAEKERQLYWELQGVSPPKKVKGKFDRADLSRAQAEAKAFRQENKDLSDWYYSLALENLKRQQGEEIAAAIPPEWIAQDAIEALEELERLGGQEAVEDTLAQAGRTPLFQAAGTRGGRPERIDPGLARRAMAKAEKRTHVWTEYIRAHYRATGDLAPGADAKDLYAWLETNMPDELAAITRAPEARAPAKVRPFPGKQYQTPDGVGTVVSVEAGRGAKNAWVELPDGTKKQYPFDQLTAAPTTPPAPRPEFGAPRAGPQQVGMFEETMEDLPLISGTAPRARIPEFAPPTAGAQGMLPGMELEIGEKAKYAARPAGEVAREAQEIAFRGETVRLSGETEELYGGTFWPGTYTTGSKAGQPVHVADEIVRRQLVPEQLGFMPGEELRPKRIPKGQQTLWQTAEDVEGAPASQFAFWNIDPSGWDQYRAAMNQPGAMNTPLPQNLLEVSNRATRQALDQMQAGIVDEWDNWQPRLASRDVRQQAMNWLSTEVTPNWYESLATGLDYGRQQADFALLDYSKRRNLDQWLGYIFPYHYWFTRAGFNWARRLAAKPGLVASYMRVRDAMRQANEQAGRRQRFGDKVKIPFPWLPDWMGGALYVDPVGLFLPLADMLYNDYSDPDEGARGLQKIFKEWRRYGLRPYHFWDYLYQSGKFAKAGEMLGMAPGEAQEMLGPEVQGDFGTMFPQSRLIQTLTAAGRQLAPEALSFIPPGGFAPEAPLRQALGLQAGEVWDPYRINRMLGNLAAEDPQNWQLARTALMAQELVDRDQTQAGKVWDPSSPLAQQVAQEMNWSPEDLARAQQLLTLAMQRATLERGMGSLGWALGPSVSIEPAGERAQLEMAEQAQQQGWSPTQPGGSRAGYQQFKEQYPAMYPRATQYAAIPGAQEGATMPAGARANWMAAKQQKAQINAQFDRAVDDLLRAQPWNTAGRRELENQRYAMLDQIDEQYPIPPMEGELPAILYGMNPAEMWDSTVEQEIRRLQQTKPDPDTFTRAGEVDWNTYYKAVDKWQAGLPQQFSFGDVQGGMYQGLDPARAVVSYEQRYDSPIEAAVKVYQDVVASPAWDSYHSTKDYPGTVGKVGPVSASALIPAILAQYRTKGWTPQQLQQELQGVVFPALSDQQALRKGEEPGQVYTAGQGQGRSAYAGGAQGNDWWNNKDIYNETAQRVQQEGWRAVYGLPWWEKYKRSYGGGGGGGSKKRYSTYGAYYSSGGRWSPYGGRWRPPYPVRGGPFQF